MKDQEKTREQLIEELNELRRQISAGAPESSLRPDGFSEDRDAYATFFHRSPDGMAIVTKDGQFVEVNPAFSTIMGYPREEIMGMNADSIWADPRDRDAWLKKMSTKGSVKAYEAKMRSKDGSTIDCLITSVERIAEDGVLQYQTILRDVTDQKHVEKECLESRERLRYLVSSSPAVIYSCRPDGDYGATFMTENITAQFGYSPEDFTGQSSFWADHIHPDDAPRVFAELPQVFEHGRHVHEYRFLHKDGTYRWVRDELKLIRDSDGTPIEILGYWVDITERKEVEEQLRLTEERYRTVADFTYDWEYWIAPDGRLLYISPSCERITGYLPEEFVDNPRLLQQIVHPDDRERLAEHLDSELQRYHKDSLSIDFRIVHRNGEERWIGHSCQAVHGTDGSYMGRRVSNRDISERVTAEEALKGAHDKLERKVEERTTELKAVNEQLVREIAERKAAEQTRDRMFALSMDLLCVGDFDGFFKQVNPAWTRALGWTQEELIYKGFFELVHPEDQHNTQLSLEQLRLGKPLENFRNRCMCKDGTFRWLSWNVIPVPEEELVFVIGRDETERMQSEEALRAQEQRFRIAAESLSDVVYEWDMGDSVQWFGKIDEIMGYAPGEFPRTLEAWANTVHPEDIDRVWKAVERHLAGEGPYDIAYRVRHKDGSWRHWIARGTALRESDGKPFRWIGAITDVTEGKMAEEALRQSEERFRSTFEQAAVGIAHVATDGSWLRVNRKLCDIVGYTTDELMGLTFQDITYPDDLDADLDQARKLLAGEINTYSMEKRYIRKDGPVVWINLTAALVRLPSGEPDYFISVVEDISTRKKTEEALRESEQSLSLREKISHIFLTVPDDEMYGGVLSIILEAMKSLHGVFGYIDEDSALVVPTMTRHVWEQCEVPDKDIVFPRCEWGDTTWPRCIREKRTICTNEPSNRIPRGHIPMDRHISMPILYQGEAIGLFQVANKSVDYTHEDIRVLQIVADHVAPILSARLRRNLEERRRERSEDELKKMVTDLERSNRELEQFAYVASHDLQEPLRMVSSYTQLLAERLGDQLDEKSRKFIDYAVDGAVRMQQLIQDLLLFSRVTTRGGAFETVDSHSALGIAVKNLQEAIHDSGALVVNDDLPQVTADQTQLVQVFQNLIGNAIKFRGQRKPRIHVSAQEQDHHWLFSVKDNGVGIDERYRDKVFVIFQRLHTREEYPGTGIGLALCQRIVQRHGGEIWFESRPGEGSTFFFTLSKKIEGGHRDGTETQRQTD